MKAVEDIQRISQSGLLDYLWKTEQSIINRLVAAYRAGKLNDRDATVGIALVSEVRSMQKELEISLVKSVGEVEKLINRKE